MISKFEWSSLDEYKKTYRESRAYKAYVKNHHNHENDLEEMIMRITSFEFFKKSDAISLNKDIANEKENIFKKVKAYQTKSTLYKVPQEIQEFMHFEDDNELRDHTDACVDKSYKQKLAQIEKDL